MRITLLITSNPLFFGVGLEVTKYWEGKKQMKAWHVSMAQNLWRAIDDGDQFLSFFVARRASTTIAVDEVHG
jgi:hypothetical protein